MACRSQSPSSVNASRDARLRCVALNDRERVSCVLPGPSGVRHRLVLNLREFPLYPNGHRATRPNDSAPFVNHASIAAVVARHVARFAATCRTFVEQGIRIAKAIDLATATIGATLRARVSVTGVRARGAANLERRAVAAVVAFERRPRARITRRDAGRRCGLVLVDAAECRRRRAGCPATADTTFAIGACVGPRVGSTVSGVADSAVDRGCVVRGRIRHRRVRRTAAQPRVGTGAGHVRRHGHRAAPGRRSHVDRSRSALKQIARTRTPAAAHEDDRPHGKPTHAHSVAANGGSTRSIAGSGWSPIQATGSLDPAEST